MLSNFSFLVDGVLAGSCHPGRCADEREALAYVKEQGFGAVVSLDEEGLPDYLMAEMGLKYLHLPVPDYCPPSLEQARKFVEFVQGERARKSPVLAHCAAGYGRTGTMLACYLVAAESRRARDAVAEVRRKRPGSIETRDQEQFVGEFERAVRKRT